MALFGKKPSTPTPTPVVPAIPAVPAKKVEAAKPVVKPHVPTLKPAE